MKLTKFVLAMVVAFPQEVLAWGQEGHETVGYIAANLIKGSNAETAVSHILKPGEMLATAAEWPDCAKGFCGPTSPSAGPAHRTVCDRPHDRRHPSAAARGAAHIQDRQYYVSATKQEESSGSTLGGNWLCVGEQGLHFMRDNTCVEAAMTKAGTPSAAAFVAYLSLDLAADASLPGDVLGRPQSWATESLRLANAQLKTITIRQQGVKGSCRLPVAYSGNMWSVELPSEYAEAARDIAEEQVRLAGKCLAETLIAIRP